MNIQDCVKFATENPVCFNEHGFYFTTLSPKAFSKQLKQNSRVEVCFYNNPAELKDAKQMRVTGEIEFLDDKELLKKVYEERVFLERLAGQPIEHLFEVFRLPTGEVYFWTLQDVMKESEVERLRFGSDKVVYR